MGFEVINIRSDRVQGVSIKYQAYIGNKKSVWFDNEIVARAWLDVAKTALPNETHYGIRRNQK